jgi:hypothetical protein
MAIRGESSRKKDKPLQHEKLLFRYSIDAGVPFEVFSGDVAPRGLGRCKSDKGLHEDAMPE